ncbi:MAG: hypothetical protein ACK4ZJ_19725, partial [Allorhizobium sp.]
MIVHKPAATIVALLSLLLFSFTLVFVVDWSVALSNTHNSAVQCGTGVRSLVAQSLCMKHVAACAVSPHENATAATSWCPNALRACQTHVVALGQE